MEELTKDKEILTTGHIWLTLEKSIKRFFFVYFPSVSIKMYILVTKWKYCLVQRRVSKKGLESNKEKRRNRGKTRKQYSAWPPKLLLWEKSQNQRMKGPRWVQSSCSSSGILEHMAQNCIQTVLQSFPRGRLKNLSGQFVPLLSHPHNKSSSSYSDGISCSSFCAHYFSSYHLAPLGRAWKPPLNILPLDTDRQWCGLLSFISFHGWTGPAPAVFPHKRGIQNWTQCSLCCLTWAE